MSTGSSSRFQSMQKVLAVLAMATPEPSEELRQAHGWLVELRADTQDATDAAALDAASSALERILAGASADPYQDLIQVGLAVELAAESTDRAAATPARGESDAGAVAPSAQAGSAQAPTPIVASPAAARTEPTEPGRLSTEIDDTLLREYIVESIDHIAAAEAALLEIEADPENAESINTVFRAFHTIKGTSGFLSLRANMELAHRAESILHRAREGEIRLTGAYADLSLEACDLLKVMIQNLAYLSPGDPLPCPPTYDDLLARLSNPEAAAAEEARGPGADTPVRRPTAAPAAREGDADEGAEEVQENVAAARSAPAKRSIAEGTVRVGTDRLDSLINLVGELVIAQSMVSQDPAVVEGAHSRLARNVTHASKIVRDLQDLTMSLRMVPLKGTFQKIARLARDLARRSEKQVQFLGEGEETEIDRNMVEALNDPLVHMIRNAVDHGLEPADQRVANGKSEMGTVRLRAYHSAGHVIIELSDDGHGLNAERIRSKAIERGLISADQVLSEDDTYGLIFLPGFSTAEKVTEVSGRGVGMDVVKRGIEGLRGRVQVTSRPGQGTTFTMQLPLTMAITDAMLVRVGEEHYLLPTVSIEQSFRPERDHLYKVAGRGEMVMLRGNIMPILRLNRLFRSHRSAVEEKEDGLLIAVEAEGRRCALMVDELLGQHQVVIKCLGEGVGEVPGVSGGTILGDGRVGLILDVPGLLKLAELGNGRGTAAAAKRTGTLPLAA